MKIICSYSFGVHTHLTEKKLTNFIRHEIAEMKTLQKLDSQQHLSQPHRERKCSITEVMYWSYRYHIFLHTCMMQCMRYMCMHVRSNMLCCPTFVDLTPKFGVHKYIYIHIQTQLKLNVLTFEKNICLFKIMKSKELSKKNKKNF